LPLTRRDRGDEKVALVTPGIYSGTSFAVIDGKGRVAVPASLRNNVPEIEIGDRKERVLWVGRHEKLKCLIAFGQNQYDNLTAEIEVQRAEARELRREFDEDAEQKKRFQWLESFVLDGSGRFSPTPTLRRYCGMSGPVAFVGAGKRFEIWSLATLAECADVDPDLREIAAEILAEGSAK
jgi:MraZ protein